MATTLSHSKQQLVRQALTQMQSSLADNTWTVREKLALTCRILFDHGHDYGLAGQISLSHHGQLSTGASVEQACLVCGALHHDYTIHGIIGYTVTPFSHAGDSLTCPHSASASSA